MKRARFAKRLLRLWAAASESREIYATQWFPDWSGASKDVLIDMSLEWDERRGRYVLLPQTTSEGKAMTGKVGWMSNPQYLAQVGHFFGAMTVILVVRHWVPAPWGIYVMLGGLALAAIKEFWFDIRYERDGWANSTMDFAFYFAGAMAAWWLP